MRTENQDNLETINKIIEKYMKIAIEEAEKSKENGENPFGAVLLDPEYNFCHKSQTRCIELSDPTAHAETLVIREYCKKTYGEYSGLAIQYMFNSKRNMNV